MADQNKKTTNSTSTTTGSDTFAEENRSFDSEVLDTDVVADEDELAGTTSAGMSNSMAMSTPPTYNSGSDFNTTGDVGSNGSVPPADSLKDQAIDKTQQVLAQTKEAAGAALSKVKDQAVEQISTQKDKAAESLTGITSALHQTTQTFRDQNQNVVADYVDSFASQADKFTQYIANKNVDELARDVESFARQNPALFVGGAFLIGMGLARFLKSSNTYDTIPRNEALVPVIPSPVSSPVSSPLSSPFNSDVSIGSDTVRDEFGDKPLSAHNYVPGIGVSNSGENV